MTNILKFDEQGRLLPFLERKIELVSTKKINANISVKDIVVKVYEIAEMIDKLTLMPNKNKIIEMFEEADIEIIFLNRGHHNRTFMIKTAEQKLVFKVGYDIEQQWINYNELKGCTELPYAKIYWATKKCLLQMYCKIVDVPMHIQQRFKIEAKKRGYSDATKANIGLLDGRFVVFDLVKTQLKENEK